MIKFHFFLLSIVFVLLGTSCNDSQELTREKAAELINNTLGYPQHEEIEFNKLYTIDTDIINKWNGGQAAPGICISSGWIGFEGKIKNALTQLSDKGLITITQEQKEGTNCITTFARIDLTNEGRNYLAEESDGKIDGSYTLNASDITLDQVTGIVRQKDSPVAIAEYTVSRSQETPFFSAFDVFGRGEYNFDTKQVPFTLYDDGWRVNSSALGMQSFSGNQHSSRQRVNVSKKVEEHKNTVEKSSLALLPTASDDKQKITIDKKYVGTYLSDDNDFFIELTDSNVKFYYIKDFFVAGEFSNFASQTLITKIVSASDTELSVRLEKFPNSDLPIINIDADDADDADKLSLSVPNSLLGCTKLAIFIQQHSDCLKRNATIIKNQISFSKINTFKTEYLKGKWYNLGELQVINDVVTSEILEITENGFNSEIFILNKKDNKIGKWVPNYINFISGFLLGYTDFSDRDRGGSKRKFVRRITHIQPDKLTMEIDSFDGKKYEQVFVPYTGQPHISKSDKNASELPELNPNQKGIVRDLLLAYKYDLNVINLVADNADYAVLARAAYEDHDALDLAKQRGWDAMQNIVDENPWFIGDTVATLFTRDNGKAVLAFRGSKTGGDWVTNLPGSLLPDLLDSQVEGAEKIAREIFEKHPNVTFVGHSLGGRLAQIGRLVTGNDAVIFNTAPLGESEREEYKLAKVNKPKGILIGFRGPQDPVATFDPASFSDVVVENIYRAESLPPKGKLSEVWVQFKEQNNYFHGAATLANAMQIVRSARDQGWIDAYLY